MTVIDRAYT